MLYAVVQRGRNKGIRVFPWPYDDGRFAVTKKKGEPYTFVDTERQIARYLALGYLLRMGNKREHHPPGLFSPESIHGWRELLESESEEQRREAERAQSEEQRRQAERAKEEERRKLQTVEDLNRLSGSQFEALIASLFKKDGYVVRHCGGSGDKGIDLFLDIAGTKDVVQCKRWKSDIGSPVIRDFYGAMMHANARHGFIITTATFSASTRAFARGKPISLISGSDLLRWIDGTYSSRDSTRRRRQPPSQDKPNGFDPYVVLGISRNASKEEIRAAYHREMANYHPDKVAHLGKELQELAGRKAQEINRAYEEIMNSVSA
jgi:restriction system protein